MKDQLSSEPESAAEHGADRERRSEITRATARPDREARRDDLRNGEQQQDLDAGPGTRQPSRTGDRDLCGAIATTYPPKNAVRTTNDGPRVMKQRADERTEQ